MTEELNIFCNKLKILLNSMNHREELTLNTIDSLCGKVFNHEIKIEKVHNKNLPETVPLLTLNHTVSISGRRILIETYTFIGGLMINNTDYYGEYGDGSFGMEVETLELMERTRLCSEDPIVNFDDLFDQMNLAAVRMI